MYEGKLVFAQLMEHLPMHTFRRMVARFGGDRWVKSFSCQDQFRAMAFAQLTYRESLRDIEICLSAKRVYSAPSDRENGIICDQTIALAGVQSSRHYPEHLRRIRFRDPATGKTLVFLTNQRTLPAVSICALYKSRWRSSCSSSGSSSICASRSSTARPRTR